MDNSDSDTDEDDYFEIDTKTTQYELRSFFDQFLLKNKINLQPEYQREFIWNSDKQDLLIDSIMRSFVIPNFVFIKGATTDDKKKYNFECIDGQHRLTVIKHFITGEKLNGNYVKWRKKDVHGKTISVFYEENKNTKNNRVRCRRFMTENEKDRFNDFNLSVCTINTELEFKDICTIFNRLQNGERTTSLDRLKNQDHCLAELIRKINIGRIEIFKQTSTGKLLWDIFGHVIKNKQTKSIKNMFSSMLMRYALIYVKGFNKITSYLDLNLLKDIETKSERADISNKTSDQIINNIGKFLKTIHKSARHKKLTIHMFYVLADIYNNTLNGDMPESVIAKIVKSKQFSEYNNDSKFCTGTGPPSPATYKEVRDIFAKLCKCGNSDSDTSDSDSDNSDSDNSDSDNSDGSSHKYTHSHYTNACGTEKKNKVGNTKIIKKNCF